MQRRSTGIEGHAISPADSKRHNRTGAEVHPYQKAVNWCSPDWQFWESDKYTDRSKKMYREFVARMQKEAQRKNKIK